MSGASGPRARFEPPLTGVTLPAPPLHPPNLAMHVAPKQGQASVRQEDGDEQACDAPLPDIWVCNRLRRRRPRELRTRPRWRLSCSRTSERPRDGERERKKAGGEWRGPCSAQVTPKSPSLRSAVAPAAPQTKPRRTNDLGAGQHGPPYQPIAIHARGRGTLPSKQHPPGLVPECDATTDRGPVTWHHDWPPRSCRTQPQRRGRDGPHGCPHALWLPSQALPIRGRPGALLLPHFLLCCCLALTSCWVRGDGDLPHRRGVWNRPDARGRGAVVERRRWRAPSNPLLLPCVSMPSAVSSPPVIVGSGSILDHGSVMDGSPPTVLRIVGFSRRSEPKLAPGGRPSPAHHGAKTGRERGGGPTPVGPGARNAVTEADVPSRSILCRRRRCGWSRQTSRRGENLHRPADRVPASGPRPPKWSPAAASISRPAAPRADRAAPVDRRRLGRAASVCFFRVCDSSRSCSHRLHRRCFSRGRAVARSPRASSDDDELLVHRLPPLLFQAGPPGLGGKGTRPGLASYRSRNRHGTSAGAVDGATAAPVALCLSSRA